MKKAKIIGLENNGERSVFIFEKNIEFFRAFSEFLKTIHLDPLHELYEDDIDLEDATDTLEHKKDELYDIDIIFGSTHVIVVIRSTVPREQYLPFIQKIATFPGFE